MDRVSVDSSAPWGGGQEGAPLGRTDPGVHFPSQIEIARAHTQTHTHTNRTDFPAEIYARMGPEAEHTTTVWSLQPLRLRSWRRQMQGASIREPSKNDDDLMAEMEGDLYALM